MFAETLSKTTYSLVFSYINTTKLCSHHWYSISSTLTFCLHVTHFSALFFLAECDPWDGHVYSLPYHQEWSCIIIHLKVYTKLCVTSYQLAGYILKLPWCMHESAAKRYIECSLVMILFICNWQVWC